MRKIIIFSNHDLYTYKLRKELIKNLIDNGFKVIIVLPYGKYVDFLKEMGCEYVNLPYNRRGMNPLEDLKLLFNYLKIIKNIEPDVVLSYTIKPNIYGGMACRILKIPYIPNITGLGTSIENRGILQKIVLFLYKIGIGKAAMVLFQNNRNMQLFKDNKIVKNNAKLIPGSGVNLADHPYEEYSENGGIINFLYIGRIMKDKGILEFIEAATIIKSIYDKAVFDIIGDGEEMYIKQIQQSAEKGVVNYYGKQDDVHSFIKRSHAIILPSYHEGIANVLLEAASTGRPVLASNVAGCRETFDDGISGLSFEAKSIDSLVDTIKRFIELPYNKKKLMGIEGRKKVEREFDRNIVVDAYLKELKTIFNE